MNHSYNKMQQKKMIKEPRGNCANKSASRGQPKNNGRSDLLLWLFLLFQFSFVSGPIWTASDWILPIQIHTHIHTSALTHLHTHTEIDGVACWTSSSSKFSAIGFLYRRLLGRRWQEILHRFPRPKDLYSAAYHVQPERLTTWIFDRKSVKELGNQ